MLRGARLGYGIALTRVVPKTRNLHTLATKCIPVQAQVFQTRHATQLKIVMPRVFIRRFASDSPPHKKLGMPALSPTMTQGNLVSWKKKEGDKISAGDIIAEIETDKATIDFEAQDDGYLAKILVPDGTKDVPINQTIAVVVDNKEDVGKLKNYSEDQPSAPKEQAPSQAPPAKQEKAQASTPQSSEKPQASAPTKSKAPQKNYPSHMRIGMPALSPTMTKGNLVSWKKKEGEQVKVGDAIAEIETDKATMDFESQEEGYIAKILVPKGASDVAINTTIAVMVDSKDDVAKFADYTDSEGSSAKAEGEPAQEAPNEEKHAEKESAPPKETSAKSSSTSARVVASPLAKAIAREKGVDLSQVTGTGPDNRIIKADVLEFSASAATKAAAQPAKQTTQAQPSAAPAAASGKAQPAPTGTYTDLPISNIRKVTAQRLLQSKQTIPHYYLTMEMRVDQLLKLRGDFNAQADGKYKLSVNDFIVKAAALAMHKVPAVNSSWTDQYIRRFHNVDINVAVNTDQGLFTPIVKDADKKGLADIANTVKSLAQKAKENKLQPAEFQGGTFTISNLGMFGIAQFAAVINPPQAAILAVGGSQKRIVQRDGSPADLEVANILTVTLSCDHRVIDGAVGAEWLQAFKDYMENPMKLLL